jgi:PAS domain S-box-containing protein
MGLLSNLLNPSKGFGGEQTAASGGGADDEVVDIADLMNKGPKSLPETAETSEREPHQETPEDLRRIFLSALMDKLGDIVYFKDRQSRFIMVNSALANRHLSTTDTSRALGRTDFDIFAYEHANKTFSQEQKIIASGEALIGIEEKEVWPDGRETWVMTSKFPLKDSHGEIIGTWGISKDITDHKRTEDELKSAEDQLRHSQKMEAFGQLAGGIAHDFNNMINVILGAAQLMELDLKDQDSDARRRVDMVIDASKRAAELTQQLLTFARKGKYTIAPINVHEVIASVVRLINHTFDKRIRVVERLNARSPVIMADYAQLQNALLNLAINARDAMPDGGVLTFETAAVGPAAGIGDTQYGEIAPGSFLRLRVGDTGCGMDKKTKARVFEPFFTTKGPGKGTGLGLASVYGTVKNFSGMIEFDSAPGAGTQFTLFLPLAVKIIDKKDDLPSGGVKKAFRLLVVEDDDDISRVLVEMLENLGYEAYSCKDGKAAIEYYTVNFASIDLCIVDLVLPRMSGHECINRFKRIDPSSRILVSSGYNLATDTQQIIIKGIAGFIQKPYQSEELARAVGEALV